MKQEQSVEVTEELERERRKSAALEVKLLKMQELMSTTAVGSPLRRADSDADSFTSSPGGFGGVDQGDNLPRLLFESRMDGQGGRRSSIITLRASNSGV